MNNVNACTMPSIYCICTRRDNVICSAFANVSYVEYHKPSIFFFYAVAQKHTSDIGRVNSGATELLSFGILLFSRIQQMPVETVIEQ